MSTESLTLSVVLPATPKVIYQAWLDNNAHGEFTGGGAEIDPRTGGKFTAWDGYISGKTLELEPYRKIVQSWRTTDFPDDSPDSRIEIWLKEIPGGTEMALIHSGIPAGQSEDYREGWEEYYFKPMREYFETK